MHSCCGHPKPGFRVPIPALIILKIYFLDLTKPKGLHVGCNLISEIPNYSISTYKRDFTGRDRNKKLDLFYTAPMNNPYTWSTYTNMMNNRCTKVIFFYIKYEIFSIICHKNFSSKDLL